MTGLGSPSVPGGYSAGPGMTWLGVGAGPGTPQDVPPTGSRSDLRSNVYGRPIPLSTGLRAVTGYPIWAGPYIIPSGGVYGGGALAGVGYVPPAAVYTAWPNIISNFAIAFGYRLAPEAERGTLSVRRIWANNTKIYDFGKVAAVGTLTCSANFSNLEAVTVGQIYTFQTTLTNANGNVKIGATLAASLINLRNAINRDGVNGVPNTDFGAATVRNPSVYARCDETKLYVTAYTPGAVGNSIASTETGANCSWGGATLAGGSDTEAATKLGNYSFTLYQGSSTQTADATISADRGDLTPGYRDMIYIVFTNFEPGKIIGSDPFQIPTITVEFREDATPKTLAAILRYLALSAGYESAEIFVDSAMTDTITGVNVSDRYDFDTLIADLGFVYNFSHVESETQVKMIRNPATPFSTITEGDLRKSEARDDAITTEIGAPADSPYSMSVSYINNYTYDWDAATFTSDSNLLLTNPVADRQLKVPFVLDINTANSFATKAWYKYDAHVTMHAFTLPPKFQLLEPTDVITVVYGGRTYTIQVQELTLNGDFSVSCAGINFLFDNTLSPSATPDNIAVNIPPPQVSGGSETHDGPSTSGNFAVPLYNTLIIEGWGSGGGSGIGVNCTSAQTAGQTAATDGADTVVNYSGVLIAYGGKAGQNVTSDSSSAVLGVRVVGGIAAGGDVNSQGESGGAPQRNGAYGAPNGYGGSSPNGGAVRTITGIAEPAGANVVDAGDAGNAPGGGASGAACTMQIDDANRNVGGGGSGAGYFKITFTIGEPGAPLPGDLVNWVIGANGVGGGFTTLGAGNGARGADGAAGRVKFTWS